MPTKSKKQIARTHITRKDGEYIVRAFGSKGRRMPEADYLTNSRKGAEDTARAMVDVPVPCPACGHLNAAWQDFCDNADCERAFAGGF